MQSLRTEAQQWHDVVIPAQTRLLDGEAGDLLEIRAEFAVTPGMSADRLGLQLRTNQQGDEYTRIGYVVASQQLFVDRMRSGAVDFSDHFVGVHMAEVPPIDGVVRLHILVDRTSVEVFANDGRVVFTDLIFPDAAGVGVELFADGGEAAMREVEIFQAAPRFRHRGSVMWVVGGGFGAGIECQCISSRMMRPSASSMVRRVRAASERLWVTIRKVLPVATHV